MEVNMNLTAFSVGPLTKLNGKLVAGMVLTQLTWQNKPWKNLFQSI